MKAAIFHGPGNICIEETGKPVCGENEILVRVNYCAICGTDVRTFYHGHSKVIPPAIIGHEITGEVAEIGKKVHKSDISPGTKITVVTSIGCGRCPLCERGYYNLCPETRAIGYFYQGGFAEYLLIPEPAVRQHAWVVLPKNVSLLDGSLIEPLSCVINAQNYLSIRKGDAVLIYGGGPIGFMHAVLAKAAGADKIIMTDPAFSRLETFAKKFTGIILIDPGKENVPARVREITDDFGADVVITACPAKQAQIEALSVVAPRGRISFFGGLPKDDPVISIDSNLIHYREISIFGAFASNRADYEKAADLISRHKIRPEMFITKVVPLEEIEEGIHLVKSGTVLKVVVQIR